MYEFWVFHKESIALATLISFPTGIFFAIGHELGKYLVNRFRCKR